MRREYFITLTCTLNTVKTIHPNLVMRKPNYCNFYFFLFMPPCFPSATNTFPCKNVKKEISFSAALSPPQTSPSVTPQMPTWFSEGRKVRK